MTELTRREAALLLGLGLGAGIAAPAGAARLVWTAKGKPGLDHIVWAVPDLDEGRKLFAELTGVEPVSGGKAPGRDRPHNALVSLGGGTYLEVFAPRVAMSSGRWFDAIQDGKPHVVSYCLHVQDEFADLQKAIPQAKLKADGPRAMGRVRPDGIQLNWKLLNISGSAVDDSLPFFIDWLGSKPHPSEDSPAGARLARFEVRHPQAAEVRRIFAKLAIDLPVVEADAPALAVHLDTPKGRVVLN